MIALDANILVYAHREESEFYDKARRVVFDLAEGSGRWGIPWACVHEFLAVVTNPKIFPVPTEASLAVSMVRHLSASPTLTFLYEGSDHLEQLGKLLAESRAAGGMIHDARIVAICLSHGVREILTADRDFSRFPSIKTRNPLV